MLGRHRAWWSSVGHLGHGVCASDCPVIDTEGLIAPFCGSSGGWLPLLCTMNATGVVEEVRATFSVIMPS